ncbi:MAG: DUF3857 domain-containing protein [Opitutales bacterium]
MLISFHSASADTEANSSFSEAFKEALKIPESYRVVEPSWGLIVADKDGRIWRSNARVSRTGKFNGEDEALFFSQMRGRNFQLSIQPVFLENTEIPLYTIAEAWYSLHGISLGESDILNMEPLEQPAGEPWLQIDTIVHQENHSDTISTLIARLDSVVIIANAWKSHDEPFVNLPRFTEIFQLHPELSLSNVSGLPRSANSTEQATVINHIGLSLFNQGNLIWAADLFKRAHRLDPFYEDYFRNSVLALQKSGQHAAVETLIKEAPIGMQKSPAIVQMRVSSLIALGESARAAEILKREIDRGVKSESVIIQYMNSLFALEEFAEVRDVGVEALEQGLNSSTIMSNLGWAYLRLEDYENARETFQGMGRLLNANLEASYGWMQLLLEEEKYEECTAFGINIFETKGDLSALSYAIRGLIETGDHDTAEEYITVGLKRNPANPDLLQWDEYVKSLTGEGVSREASTPIEALVINQDLQTQIDTWKSQEPAVSEELLQNIEDKGAMYNEVTTITEWISGDSYTTTTRLVATIKSKSTVDAFKQFVFNFNPFSESIYINKIEVRDETGAILATENRDKFVVRHEDSSAYATEDRILIVPIPSIRKGRTLELVYTRQRRGTEVKFPFTQNFFTGVYPVMESHYILHDKEGALHAKASGIEKHVSLENGALWSVFNAKGLPSEDNLPTPVQIEPVLRISSQEKSWTELASDYKERIDHTLTESSETMDEWIKEHIEKHSNHEDSLASALTAIRENFNYQGYLFGERAQVPNLPSDIINNGYGDCKDLSLLLHKTLEFLEIPSFLTLVNTKGAIATDIPSIDQFDHMIVYSPGLGESGRFLDATEAFATGLTDPTHLQNVEAFVLDWDNPRFEKINHSKPTETPIYSEREVVLETDGAINVTESITMRGRAAENFKRWLSTMTPTERRDAIQRWMNHNKLTLQVDSISTENVESLYTPLFLEITASTSTDSLQPNSSNSLDLPIISEALFVSVPQTTDREFDYQRTTACRITVDTTLKLPSGWSAQPVTTADTPEAQTFGIDISVDWDQAGSEFSGTSVINVEKPVIPADQFETYKKYLNNRLGDLGPRIHIIPYETTQTTTPEPPGFRL